MKSTTKGITFGTDGWRGVIARDFTEENVARVAQAIADYFQEQPGHGSGIVLGYDTRFLSPDFARLIAEVLAGNGISVLLSTSDVPTQCVSFTVKRRHRPGGIMITASHNPPRFSGIKIKASFGGPATPDITDQVEARLDRRRPVRMDFQQAVRERVIQEQDLLPAYLEGVRQFLRMDLINRAGLRLVYDPMFGVGSGIMQELLSDSSCSVREIHSKYNPGFGGLNPEPIEDNLQALMHDVSRDEADAGFATDGDADRMGLVDEHGRYLTPHQVFSLLLLYLIEVRQMKGGVVKALSLGYQPDRIARKYRLPIDEVPVGFKHVCDKMLRGDVFFGGEESGGYGYRDFLPERDGLLSLLLFVEMMTERELSISQLLQEMESKFGQSHFKRIDLQREGVNKDHLVAQFTAAPPSSLGGIPLKELKTIDGVKVILKDDSWFLVRPSGTEPKVRMYAEAPDEKLLQRIIEDGIEATERIIQSPDPGPTTQGQQ